MAKTEKATKTFRYNITLSGDISATNQAEAETKTKQALMQAQNDSPALKNGKLVKIYVECTEQDVPSYKELKSLLDTAKRLQQGTTISVQYKKSPFVFNVRVFWDNDDMMEIHLVSASIKGLSTKDSKSAIKVLNNIVGDKFYNSDEVYDFIYDSKEYTSLQRELNELLYNLDELENAHGDFAFAKFAQRLENHRIGKQAKRK